MGFKDLVSKAQTHATAVGQLAGDQLTEWMKDYKKATNTLETIGFAVGKFMIGMGVLAEVHTTLSGKIAGNLDKTTFTFDFELNLPAKDAAAGMSCGKQ